MVIHEGLCATWTLQFCSISAIVSEVPLMYGIVAVIRGPELTLVQCYYECFVSQSLHCSSFY